MSEDLNFVCEMLFQIQFVPISFQQAYKAGKKQPNEPHNVQKLAIMSKNRATVTWSGVCLFLHPRTGLAIAKHLGENV